MIGKYNLLFVPIFLFFYSCESKKENNKNSNKDDEQTQTLSETSIENKKDFALMPFEEDTLDYEHAVIDNFSKPVTDTVIISNKKQNEETTLFMKSSFTIRIKPKSFTYDDGKPVNEDVKVVFKNLEPAACIATNNINMNYDSAGTNYQLQSAGMFSVELLCKSGRIIKIKKAIEVVKNNVKNPEDYNIYQYQKSSSSWKFVKNVIQKNNSKQFIQNEIIEAPVKPNKKDFVFDMDVDISKHEELKAFKNIVWQYASVSKYPDPKNNQWIFDENWKSAQILSYNKAKNQYLLKLSNNKKAFETVVTRALQGADYELAMKQFSSFKSNKKNSSKITEAVTININETGIYNIDKINFLKNAYRVEASMYYNNKPITDGQVYLIYNNAVNVINFSPKGINSWDKFAFESNINDNLLLYIAKDGTLAYASQNQFDIIKKQKHKSYRFTLSKIPVKINNALELQNWIKSI